MPSMNEDRSELEHAVEMMSATELRSLLTPDEVTMEFYESISPAEDGFEPNTIDEYFDILSEVDGLDVQIVQVRNDYRVLQVNAPDPKAMRKELVNVIGSKLGIVFLAPRKTKKDGYTLEIPTCLDDDMDEEECEPIVVRIKKGGSHRAGRKNELDFQKFIQSEV